MLDSSIVCRHTLPMFDSHLTKGSAMRKTYDVTIEGMVVRFSATAMKKNLEAVQRGEDFNLSLGKVISTESVRLDDLINPYGETKEDVNEVISGYINNVANKRNLYL